MFAKSKISCFPSKGLLEEGNEGLKRVIQKFFSNKVFPLEGKISQEKDFGQLRVQKEFIGFCQSVWKQKFGACSREELCQAVMPHHWGSVHFSKIQKLWWKELALAWEKIISTYPTFVLYFREGAKFSKDSLEAFITALKNCETEEFMNGGSPQISLFLGNNGIDDEGACLLAQAMNSLETLVHLDLKNNQIGERGTIALAEALKENESLKVLDLSANRVSENGGIALAQALEKNVSLKSLSLSTEQVSVKVAKSFEIACSQNTVIENLDIWK